MASSDGAVMGRHTGLLAEDMHAVRRGPGEQFVSPRGCLEAHADLEVHERRAPRGIAERVLSDALGLPDSKYPKLCCASSRFGLMELIASHRTLRSALGRARRRA